MKIYRKHVGEKHRVFVQPGNDFPDNTDFVDGEGKPKMFTVEFVNGVAEVADNLGRYMVDNKLARSHQFMLPGD